MKYSAVLLLGLLCLQSIAFKQIHAEDIEGSGEVEEEILIPAVVPQAGAEPEIIPPDEEIPLEGGDVTVEEIDAIKEVDVVANAAPEEGEPEEVPVEEPYVEVPAEEEKEVVEEVIVPVAVATNDEETLPDVEEVPVNDEEELPIEEVIVPVDVAAGGEGNPPLEIPVEVPETPNVMRAEPEDEEPAAVEETDLTTPADPTSEPENIEEVPLSADGSPVFSADCPSQKIVPEDSAVTIRCKVTSNTEMNNFFFYWHQYLVIHLKDDEVTEDHEFKVIENNSSKIMLMPQEKSEPIHSGSLNTTTWGREGSYFGLVYPQADGSAILELKIDHMMAQMYRRHFFVAENEQGSAEYVIEFKRDASTADNSATSVASSLLSFLTILTFTILLH